MEMMEISTVAHFLGEDVRSVAFAADVGDGDSAIGNPLPGGVFSVLNVAVALGCRFVAPLDAGIIVVIGGWGMCSRVWDSRGRLEAGDHISCIDGEVA